MNCQLLLPVYSFPAWLALSQDGVISHASSNTISSPLTLLQTANSLGSRGGGRDGSKGHGAENAVAFISYLAVKAFISMQDCPKLALF